jgi:L-iditol 2-dehydrogenase
MAELMLAAVYHGPEQIRLEERRVPEISDNELLIKVVSTGVCGTDIRIYHGSHRKYPTGTVRIPGHEVVGDIVEIGKSVSGFDFDQRVFIAPNMGCGHCRQCVSGKNNLCADYQAFGITIDGSFAEYMRVPQSAILQGNIIPISKDIDPASAALIEPFACVLRGQDAVQITPGETVLVIGAGPIGAMHVLLAKLQGASKVLVSELIPERQALVKILGADRTINPVEEDLLKTIRDETDGIGVDVVITATPAHKAQETALEVAAIGGRINFFGGLPKDKPTINFNSNTVHYKELVVTGTTACSTDDCLRAARIVDSGRIDLGKMISARFILAEVQKAIVSAEAGKALKVVIDT